MDEDEINFAEFEQMLKDMEDAHASFLKKVVELEKLLERGRYNGAL